LKVLIYSRNISVVQIEEISLSKRLMMQIRTANRATYFW